MKSLLLSVLLLASASSALAQSELAQQDTIVHLDLGRALYNASVRKAMILTSGEKELKNISWDLSGFNFSAKDNCPRVLPAHSSCKIYVTYWNTSPGPATATMKVWTSAENYTVYISAYGERMPNPPRYPVFP